MGLRRCRSCSRLTSDLGDCYWCAAPREAQHGIDLVVAKLLCFDALAAGLGACAVMLTEVRRDDGVWLYLAYFATMALVLYGLVRPVRPPEPPPPPPPLGRPQPGQSLVAPPFWPVLEDGR